LAASGTGNIAAFPAVNTGTAPVVATINRLHQHQTVVLVRLKRLRSPLIQHQH
jgi:hypothetical protein